jgi:adenosine deaminase
VKVPVRAAGWFVLIVVLASGGCARAVALASARPASTPDASINRYLQSIRADTVKLIAFLRDMPKGGDLHNHLGGAIYAESMIKWAGADGLCLTVSTFTLAPPPCAPGEGKPPAAAIAQNTDLFNKVIDAWSMRHFDYSHQLGHDHFFDTFGKFGLIHSHLADMLAEVTSRAAADHLSYLELMQTLDGGVAAKLGTQVGYNADFGVFRDRLLTAGLRESLAVARKEFDGAEIQRRVIQDCHGGHPDPGCGVTVRFLYQVLRGMAPEVVFAQILTGFELARADSQVVGFNLVMPEDAAVPMRDFSLHMAMIDYLHRLYPEVHISLHAGELVNSLVPAQGLTFHIRESIETGHAERIGHGVDALQETDAPGLLREMAARNVLVEVALTSNDAILGVHGSAHPLAAYLRAHVPVALVTDDEGVSRSDMTHEYLRGVTDQGLDYATLRTMARNSLTYSFAQPPLKERLLQQFEAAMAQFEARWASAAP